MIKDEYANEDATTTEITQEIDGNKIIFEVKNGTDESVKFLANYLATGLDMLQELLAGRVDNDELSH